MKEYVERERKVKALLWEGFKSLPELVEIYGDMVNILLRHDESVLIFDNAFNLSQYVTVSKGDYIVHSEGNYTIYDKAHFEKKYVEVSE